MDDDAVWEEKVRPSLESLLAAAKWNPKKKTVTLEVEDDDGDSDEVVCRSYAELQGALYDAGISFFRANSAHDAGEDDFELDDSMIDEILHDNYAEQMQQLGWEI